MDIYPLLALMLVLFIAFWSSIWMLINVELEAEYNPFEGYWAFDVQNVGHGMYTDFDSNLSHHSRGPILVVFYETYMFVLQIILLNMLIALMAESNDGCDHLPSSSHSLSAPADSTLGTPAGQHVKSKSCGASFIRVLAGFARPRRERHREYLPQGFMSSCRRRMAKMPTLLA